MVPPAFTPMNEAGELKKDKVNVYLRRTSVQTGCGLVQISDIILAKELGFYYVELLGRQVASMNDMEFGEVAELLRKTGIVCEGFNGYCPPQITIAGPGYDPKAVAAYAAKLAVRGRELGIKVVGIGSPLSRMLPVGYDRKRAKKQLKDFLKITAYAMGQYGITVCLEALAPCYCNFINNTDEAVEITRGIGWETVKVVLDYYNMEYTGEADLDMRDWIQDIGHVHISDDAGSPSQRYFLRTEKFCIHEQRLRNLVQNGYKGAVTLEVDLPISLEDAGRSLKLLKGIKKGDFYYGI